eukprot:TRINITY_DN39_c0_g1_i3.p1 TRINITY_DN39_c0_g1~~TRINITY_DN39_c0_g1_i3.p1  ORF type:complete len:396 (-),score=52.64 TRINITY_DN39_c0_g1_i3:112-1212(-)
MLVVPSNNAAVSRQSKTSKSETNKENDAKKLNRSKSRDPLSNITNAAKASKNVSQAGKVLKIERSKSSRAKKASLAESDESTKPEKQEIKRKSDPMVIDWEDIDAPDAEDPQALTEFVNDIYEHLFEKEKTDRLSPTFLANQTEITDRMRSILVDWLIEVHRMFKLMPETLFLAINIIDRFLSLRVISRDKLQLVGITSMLIASKYEEIYAPCCGDFVYISDGAYSKEQILLMEQQILNTLHFNLLHPSPLHFLRRFSKAAGSDYTIHTLCKYLIELMLLDVRFIKYTASQIAAGSVYVARMMTDKAPWTSTLEHYTTYSLGEVLPVARDMNDFLKAYGKSSLKAAKKKYSSSKYGQVADIAVVDF